MINTGLPHGIPTKLIPATETESVKLLKRILQQIWKTEQWSTEWKHSICIPIFKKGDAQACSGHRNKAPTSHTSKMMREVSHHRLLPSMDQEVPGVKLAQKRKGSSRSDCPPSLDAEGASTEAKGFQVSLCHGLQSSL